MKQWVILFLVVTVVFTFTSCDQVKEAYQETFRTTKNTDKKSKEVFYNPFNSVKKTQARTLDQYRKLLHTKYPDLDSVNIDRTIKMVTDAVEKWNQTEVSLLFQPDTLDKIQAELYTELHTENVQLYASALFVEHQRVRLPIVNPSNPNEVDWYWYETQTGKWTKKEPVKQTKIAKLATKEKGYPLASIKLRTASQVLYEVMKRLDEVGTIELPSSVTYFSHPHKPYWTISLKGDRADYTLETDPQGKFIKLDMR